MAAASRTSRRSFSGADRAEWKWCHLSPENDRRVSFSNSWKTCRYCRTAGEERPTSRRYFVHQLEVDALRVISEEQR